LFLAVVDEDVADADHPEAVMLHLDCGRLVDADAQEVGALHDHRVEVRLAVARRHVLVDGHAAHQ
jgi:hypothetical protein